MRLKHIYLGTATAIIALAPVLAHAEESKRFTIDAPAQELSTQLIQIARTARVQLLFSDPQIGHLRAPALRGTLTLNQMLEHALSGTGYTFYVTERGTVRVIRADQAHIQPVAAMQIAGDTQSGASASLTAASAPEEVLPAQPDIVVVGTQIKGRQTEALPVRVLGASDIANTGAVSGDELFRSIPQMGDVTFNTASIPNSSNSARGDVGSVNLRSIGAGNTLVLLNGRRVVDHPVSQADENSVPVLTYNTNAIPVSGVERLEVLLDGAAAIYGTDAVGGVINTVLRKDYSGITLETQYGYAEHTNMREANVNGTFGHNFGDRGNVTLFASYNHRDPLHASDQYYTASRNRMPLFANTPFAGLASLNGAETTTPFANLQTPAANGTIRAGAVALTNATGQFHIQPSTNAGCQLNIANGLCIDDGTLATGGADANLRFDTRSYTTTILPKINRINLFATGHYELTPGLEVFGEVGVYLAKSTLYQEPTHTSATAVLTVPASNYYNPFGPITFADGTVNPNRIPGLTNVPAAGLPVTINSYSYADLGPTRIDVDNSQYRFLAGVRFNELGFKWESAALYSWARVQDTSDGISATALQRQLALSTPDAYNPFNGGSLTNPGGQDTTPSTQAALNAIKIRYSRISKSTLALADLKGSNAHLFDLPGGAVGLAIGAEVRRETQFDNRDPRIDGTTTFTNSVTGVNYTSDVIGVSPQPDTRGRRDVISAYGEFAIPLVSPDMNIPLMRHVELQIAGRFEHYSDVGNVAKPKVAAAWDVVNGLRFRGSWSQGFKAPNLEELNGTGVARTNTRTDYIRCAARTMLPTTNPLYLANFANCSESVNSLVVRSGNPDLRPETSTNWSVGVVIEPRFIPSSIGRVTFTADLWHISQKNIVGATTDVNALLLDYLARVKGGSNPNVIRAAPTADDTALFTAAGLAPTGQLLYITDQYRNLLPQTASGLDVSFNYQSPQTSIGKFSLSINAAYLRKYFLSPSQDIASLLAAQAAGTITKTVTISGGGSLLQQDGRPKWKGSASLTWTYKQFQLGAYTQYTGAVYDTSLTDSVGENFLINSQVTGNLYLQVTVPEGGKSRYRLRLGVRNITNALPPLASSGYQANLYNPYGRYFYANAKVEF